MSLTLKSSDQEWSLSGPLNVQTLKHIWRQGHHAIDKTAVKQIELNLNGVTAPDSASVALLIDWLRYAKQQHKTIRLHHVPKKMQEIIDLSNLQNVLVIV